MEIKCTVEEFRELLQDTTKKEARKRLKQLIKEETPVAGTTDVDSRVIEAINQLLRIEGKEQLS